MSIGVCMIAANGRACASVRSQSGKNASGITIPEKNSEMVSATIITPRTSMNQNADEL